MASELFDIGSVDSLVRQIFRERKPVRLNETDVSSYEVREGYEIRVFQFDASREIYKDQVKKAADEVVEEAIKQGYPNNLRTAIYEAILNAHQHGNECNPNKRVTVYFKLDDKAEFSVIDQGGLLDPELIAYVINHRNGGDEQGFLSFYDFTGTEPKTKHNQGTFLMHTYVDEVKYFKSIEGGLVVHLTVLPEILK